MKVVHALLFVLVTLCLGSRAAVEYTSDFASLGPCDVAEQPLEPLVLPEESGCGSYCRLSPRLHLPVLHNSSASTATTPGSPVTTNDPRCSTSSLSTVVFFSGFQLRSVYYTPYARWLASWGFACVQYDLALLHIVPDEVEVGWPVAQLLAHVGAAMQRATAGCGAVCMGLSSTQLVPA